MHFAFFEMFVALVFEHLRLTNRMSLSTLVFIFPYTFFFLSLLLLFLFIEQSVIRVIGIRLSLVLRIVIHIIVHIEIDIV